MRALVVILAILLAAVPAAAQDPLPTDVPRTVKSAVTVEDEALGAGTWMSPTRAASAAAKMAKCEADKKQLQDALEAKPTQPPETDGKIALGVTLGAVGGTAVGVILALVAVIATGHIK